MKSDISKAKIIGGKVRKVRKIMVSVDPAIKGKDFTIYTAVDSNGNILRQRIDTSKPFHSVEEGN